MRLLAIGDIHGHSRVLTTLLDFVRPAPADQLITLGDYVDRGPDSRGVLDRLVGLHASGRLVALRGNHDVMMLEALRDFDRLRGWLMCDGDATLDSYGGSVENVPDAHRHFLETVCRDVHETERHFFVHANVHYELPLDEQSDLILHWEKLEPGWSVPHASGKVMVCGHSAQRSGVPLNLGHAVCVDTNVHGDGGWLTCLDVERGFYWQANRAGETRQGWLEEP